MVGEVVLPFKVVWGVPEGQHTLLLRYVGHILKPFEVSGDFLKP